MSTLADRVANLEETVNGLKREIIVLRVARTPSPRSKRCVKGNDPATCENASTYQYQHGCGGLMCRVVNSEYYSKRKPTYKVVAEPVATPVAPPRRKMMKRVTSKAG